MSHAPVESVSQASTRLEEFFGLVASAFATASSQAGETRSTLRIGNRILELRFAGDALRSRLFPAFAHRVVPPPGPPDFRIGIWDTASTGVDLPAPAWRSGKVVRGLLTGYTEGAIRTAREHHNRGFSIIHETERTAFFHVPAAAALPPSESSFPLRTLLNWWLRREGRPLIHAGAVGDERGAVLLAGMGGSGKSNTTLTCLEAGMHYAGDDFVSVDVATARVFSLYNSAKLFSGDLDRYPRLREMVAHAGGAENDKAVLFLYPRAQGRLANDLPVRALLLPRVTPSQPTRLVPVSAATAVRRMAPSTMIHLPGAEGEELAAMARLAARVPAFALELGGDRDEIVAVIRSVLANDGRPPPS